MSGFNKAKAFVLLFICLQRCQTVSATISKQCQYNAVPHSLITIARFATYFITAGQDMHFSALNNQGHWRVIRRSRLKFYGFHKKKIYYRSIKINETCVVVCDHKLQCMFEEYAKDNQYACFDVHSCQCFRDTI